MQKRLLDKTMKLFASPVLLHYTLPALMLFLIIGTIAQKYIGLYEATRIFFASPFFWIGPIPIPGLPLILCLITLNLAGKLLFKSPWQARNAGIIIAHIGALLLMAGGLLTNFFSEEGFIDLPVGKSSTTISDYHHRELAILDSNNKTITAIPFSELHKNQIIPLPEFNLTILDFCRHCKIEKRTNADETYHGMAQFMNLTSRELNAKDEENMGGVTFRANNLDETQNGTYVVIEDIPKLPEFKVSDKIYRASLRKSQRKLPFTLELLDFKREVYPGTDKPKSYESTVIIHDNGAQWQSIISMNAPLRYKGYTFFQSSFASTPDGNISVLAVVWNVGRTFPYIASLTMGFGLLLHLFLRRRT